MLDRPTDRQTGYPSIDKPWLKFYSKEAINASLPECTIYEYLIANNKDYPSDIAIHYVGRKITYKKFFDCIDKTAAAFTALGIRPGEIVTVAMPSIPEALYTVYALNKIGAVANMIHPLAGEPEMVNYLNEVKSRVAVLYEGSYSIVKNALKDTTVQTAIVVSAGESLPLGTKMLFFLKKPRISLPKGKQLLSWPDFLQKGTGIQAASFAKNPDTLALISHTGGTTGIPKGVMCSDRNANALMHQIVCNFKYDRQGVSLAVLPPFVNYSLVEAMMAMLAIGYQVALIPDYQPLKLGEYINKYHPNIVLSIPAYWEALLNIEHADQIDMSCFEQIYAGGEAMNEESEQAVNQILSSCGSKTPLMKGLGSTEMTGGATQTYENCNIPGSVGIPLVKVNCKIVDPDNYEELVYRQIGEICFTGDTMMMGYYNNPEATDAIIKCHADGKRWLHTGDLGYMDEDGVLYVTGRIKRIFMTKGRDGNVTKIFPDRIESAIYHHDAVALCCVIGLPDTDRIHYPAAFVVLRTGTLEQETVTEEILALCRKELPAYMVPERIYYCDDLPRTPRGKVDYRELEKIACRYNEPSA